MIVILGHTAAGKTTLAAHVAKALGAAVVSADSRQVYRGMSIGTGKDLADYVVDGYEVPYYLVDIVDAGEKYNVFQFQKDFYDVYDRLHAEGKEVVLCGGTGMYLESVLRSYQMLQVPVNEDLRKELEGKSLAELEQLLTEYRTMHNTSDVDTAKRAIRAIEIAEYQKEHEIEMQAREIPAKVFK